jgi:V/A-type H+/Na+-transporting ATPase subunit E
MQTKLQELTEKIYHEGLEKGNEEASKIIAQARLQAQEILIKARAEEEKILNDASLKAKELKENTESELRIAMRQSLNSLKQQVVGLVNSAVTSESMKEVTNDPAFIRDLIKSIAQNWSASASGNLDLSVILPASKEKELSQYFLNQANHLMTKGLDLKFDSRLKSGFEIGPANGGYRISFSDEVFESFFKEYLRPRLMDYLFGK